MPIKTDGDFDKALEQIGSIPVFGWVLYIPLMLITGPFRHSWKNALIGLAILGGAGYLVWAADMGAPINAAVVATAAMIVGTIWYPGEDSYLDHLINGDNR